MGTAGGRGGASVFMAPRPCRQPCCDRAPRMLSLSLSRSLRLLLLRTLVRVLFFFLSLSLSLSLSRSLSLSLALSLCFFLSLSLSLSLSPLLHAWPPPPKRRAAPSSHFGSSLEGEPAPPTGLESAAPHGSNPRSPRRTLETLQGG